jgi:predicted flavoprotein YhiN
MTAPLVYETTRVAIPNDQITETVSLIVSSGGFAWYMPRVGATGSLWGRVADRGARA